ncbi:MAG: PilZ domain-containing protein [Candidatus Aminicenantes bacterium]|nr:PilZ domain-containing protein [Candidatus Aminicenantes bacterium]
MQKKEIESVNETKQTQIKYRKEKRMHLRLSIRLPIFCYCLTSKNYFFSYCKNISPGGMSLSSDVFSKLDEFMEFKIEFPGRTISCKGKIVSLTTLIILF